MAVTRCPRFACKSMSPNLARRPWLSVATSLVAAIDEERNSLCAPTALNGRVNPHSPGTPQAVFLIPEPHTARAGSSLALVAVGLHPLASFPNDQCLRLFRMIKRLAKPT